MNMITRTINYNNYGNDLIQIELTLLAERQNYTATQIDRYISRSNSV